jgi:hypothetical protein
MYTLPTKISSGLDYMGFHNLEQICRVGHLSRMEQSPCTKLGQVQILREQKMADRKAAPKAAEKAAPRDGQTAEK